LNFFFNRLSREEPSHYADYVFVGKLFGEGTFLRRKLVVPHPPDSITFQDGKIVTVARGNEEKEQKAKIKKFTQEGSALDSNLAYLISERVLQWLSFLLVVIAGFQQIQNQIRKTDEKNSTVETNRYQRQPSSQLIELAHIQKYFEDGLELAVKEMELQKSKPGGLRKVKGVFGNFSDPGRLFTRCIVANEKGIGYHPYVQLTAAWLDKMKPHSFENYVMNSMMQAGGGNPTDASKSLTEAIQVIDQFKKEQELQKLSQDNTSESSIPVLPSTSPLSTSQPSPTVPISTLPINEPETNKILSKQEKRNLSLFIKISK